MDLGPACGHFVLFSHFPVIREDNIMFVCVVFGILFFGWSLVFLPLHLFRLFICLSVYLPIGVPVIVVVIARERVCQTKSVGGGCPNLNSEGGYWLGSAGVQSMGFVERFNSRFDMGEQRTGVLMVMVRLGMLRLWMLFYFCRRVQSSASWFLSSCLLHACGP